LSWFMFLPKIIITYLDAKNACLRILENFGLHFTGSKFK
jgi:hypothetical protein